MAATALSDSEIVEYHDSPAELAAKIDRLAELVKAAAGRFVVFTGAGISTNAGIPDFRGPHWRVDSEGTRMSYLVSQNCDGLHLRSGVPPESMSELHGNCNVEACPECGGVYWRPERCRTEPNWDCLTGRACPRECGGQLRYTTVAFGQSMPDLCFERAEQYSKQARLCLAMGTSMRVEPACSLPLIAKRRKQGHLCIVNYQKTPFDDDCDVRIFADCDQVMQMLCERLGQVIPPVADLVNETNKDRLREWHVGFAKNWAFRRPDPRHTWCSKKQTPKPKPKPKQPSSSTPSSTAAPSTPSAASAADRGGLVEPKRSCPHITTDVRDSALSLEEAKKLFEDSDYQCHSIACGTTEELWLCLHCLRSFCGRYQHGHGLVHSKSSHNCSISMSLSDLNAWCYACDCYVLNENILPHYVVLHLAKFGTLPPGFKFRSK